jgi:hypothetical protein
MICPKCKTEYREGFFICAECNINLVDESSSIQKTDTDLDSDLSTYENIFETLDSYEFLDACNLLKDARIPFAGDDFYTGEFRASRRAQAPYVWTLLVPTERVNEAIQLLDEKKAGESVDFSQTEAEPMKPITAWILLSAVAAIATFLMLIILKR